MAGLAIRTRTGGRLNAQLEQVILRRVPGFTFVKTIAQGLTGLESGFERSVALARIEDAYGIRPEYSYPCGRLDLLPDGRPPQAARRFRVDCHGVYYAARHRLARVAR